MEWSEASGVPTIALTVSGLGWGICILEKQSGDLGVVTSALMEAQLKS